MYSRGNNSRSKAVACALPDCKRAEAKRSTRLWTEHTAEAAGSMNANQIPLGGGAAGGGGGGGGYIGGYPGGGGGGGGAPPPSGGGGGYGVLSLQPPASFLLCAPRSDARRSQQAAGAATEVA